MSLLNGQNVCDEVAWRIAYRLAANSSGAGSIISMANDALGLISSAGSWTWDQTSLINAMPATVLASMTGSYPMDAGKKIAIFNTATQTPIVKVTQDSYGSSSAGYVNTSTTEYNTFRTQLDSIITGYAILDLFPATAIGNIDIYYHQLPPVLTYGASPSVRWIYPEMDMLLKDWTTAIAMKWLGMTGWDANWADCMGRVAEFSKTFTTERENTGPQSEASGDLKEKLSVGRV